MAQADRSNSTTSPDLGPVPHTNVNLSLPTISRRGIIAALAGAAAVNVPVIAATAGPHPDEALLDLGRQYRAAKEAEEAALEVMDAASDAFADTTPTPPALMVNEGDHELFGFLRLSASKDRSDGYDYADVTRLRKEHRTKLVCTLIDIKTGSRTSVPNTRVDFDPYTTELPTTSVPFPEAQVRADEIIVAWDTLLQLREEADETTGYSAASDVYDAATDARLALVEKIAAQKATTLEGLCVRAMIVAGIHADRDLDPEDTHTTDETMLWATIRDLAAMNT